MSFVNTISYLSVKYNKTLEALLLCLYEIIYTVLGESLVTNKHCKRAHTILMVCYIWQLPIIWLLYHRGT